MCFPQQARTFTATSPPVGGGRARDRFVLVLPRAQEIQRALTAANQALSSLGAVNRQALDQYTSFTQQRQDLVSRKVGGGLDVDRAVHT